MLACFPVMLPLQAKLPGIGLFYSENVDGLPLVLQHFLTALQSMHEVRHGPCPALSCPALTAVACLCLCLRSCCQALRRTQVNILVSVRNLPLPYVDTSDRLLVQMMPNLPNFYR